MTSLRRLLAIALPACWMALVLPASADEVCVENRCFEGAWVEIKTFPGEFEGAANLSRDSAEAAALEAQAHRTFSFEISQESPLEIAYGVDISHVDAGFPNRGNIGIDVSVVVDANGKTERHGIYGSKVLLVPAHATLTLYVDQETANPGFKTFYPARWRVGVRQFVPTGGSADLGTAPSIVDIIDAEPDGCGDDMVECLPPDDPEDPVDLDQIIDSQLTAPDGACRDGKCYEPDPILVPQPDPMPDPPTDMMECGTGLECLPPSDDMISDVNPDEIDRVTAADPPPAVAPPPAADPALDLAFWQAISESDDPAMFRAYLDRFPNGTFVPIAKARLATLSAGQANPPAAAPATQVTQSPQELYEQAMSIMNTAFQLDVSAWDEHARRAIPLFEAAAKGGWAPAYVELGGLVETGIGAAANPDRAVDYFLKAGQLGQLEGYERAMMLLDQIGNGSAYVETALALYRADPGWALDVLAYSGGGGPLAMQRYLRDRGYYTGVLDGDFGPASRAALKAFASGASIPSAATAPQPGSTNELAASLQKALQQVGCYIGQVDGQWGPASANAMSSFNHWNGSQYPVDQPTANALSAVTAAPGLICGVD